MRKYLLFILLLTVFNVNAQQPSYFMFGQAQFEGIDIYNIIQDHDYNYWFATDQGLYEYDGYKFTKIECEEMRAHSVFNFTIDSKGIIYCINLSQQVFKIEDGKCSLIFEIPDKGNDLHIIVNKKDELYISTSRKVYVLNANHELIHEPIKTNNYMLGPPFLTKDGSIIQHLPNNKQILAYKDGASKFISFKNFKTTPGVDHIFHFINLGTTTYGIVNSSKDIYSISTKDLTTTSTNKRLDVETALLRYYSVQNTLWVGNNISGVMVLDNSLNRIHASEKIFNDYFVSFVYEDKEGNILLATFDQGIIVIPDINIQDVVPEFSDFNITRIIKGADNDLFFGTRDGGILKYDGKLSTISHVSNKNIECLFYWKNHDLLLEDTKGGTMHNTKNHNAHSLQLGSLKDAICTQPNELLLALNVGLVALNYDPEKKEFKKSRHYVNERSYCLIQESNSKGIYLSTSSGLRYSHGNWGYFLMNHKGKPIHAYDLATYKNKTYVASSQYGILIVEKGKVVKQLQTAHNETPLTIFKFIFSDNFIYANTQIGLVVLNLEGKLISYLNKSNGLTANKVIDFEIFKDELWITHARGIQRFNIKDISSRVSIPTLRIRKISVNNQSVATVNDEGVFHSNQRNFKFEFHVPTLRHRDNIRYHYKLEGNSNDWSINNFENNEVIYNALAPGNYRFSVKAENNGVFSQPIVYSFTITAPYYQRWWFITLITLFCIVIVSMVYIRQLNIHKRKAQQLNELNASRLTAIQSQMNPHFIFNSLNSIQDLVLKGDIDNSYTFITKFSNLVRRTLNYSDKDVIDFEQEIKLIELYLSLEKLRFKDNLDYTIETNGIEDIKIPPMLIQPFIENALVHGLLHKVGKKLLTIHFTLDEVLICEIRDNGIGREKAQEIKNRQGDKHESFAVNAIKRRFTILMNHYKGQLGFTIEDIQSDNEVVGTKVTVRIPVQLKY